MTRRRSRLRFVRVKPLVCFVLMAAGQQMTDGMRFELISPGVECLAVLGGRWCFQVPRCDETDSAGPLHLPLNIPSMLTEKQLPTTLWKLLPAV